MTAARSKTSTPSREANALATDVSAAGNGPNAHEAAALSHAPSRSAPASAPSPPASASASRSAISSISDTASAICRSPGTLMCSDAEVHSTGSSKISFSTGFMRAAKCTRSVRDAAPRCGFPSISWRAHAASSTLTNVTKATRSVGVSSTDSSAPYSPNASRSAAWSTTDFFPRLPHDTARNFVASHSLGRME